VMCLEACSIMVTCLGVHSFGGAWITKKLSAIFEALIVGDVYKLVVRVFMMLINCNNFWWC
jgi:hypothetical protein